MINAAREKVIRVLRGDSDLFSVINGRIYPADIASLTNPTYPCMTASFSGGVPDEYNQDLGDASCLLQFYSTKSYSECWDMYKKAKAVLSFNVFSDAEVTIRITEDSLPFERFDTEARVYILTNNWNVFMIGA